MALTMPSLKALLDEYGLRFEEVIAESGDPAVAMDIIAVEAERVGLIDSAALPRREDVWSFVMDLWTHNPLVPDRFNLHRDCLPRPDDIDDIAALLEVLR